MILGASALVLPLAVAQRLVRIDVLLMVVLSLIVLLLSLNGEVGRLEGLFLTAGLVGYIGFTIFESRQDSDAVKAEYAEEFGGETVALAIIQRSILDWLESAWRCWLWAPAGWWMERQKSPLALGLSDLIIGLTVVAVGTSLPEVATSIVAALKGESDIAVGNAVGSNIFNILAVLGVASLVSPTAIEVPTSAIRFDLPVMLVVAVASLPIFFKGIVTRLEAGLFLGYYAAYLAYTILVASAARRLGYI